jgi:hypothetical protein
MTFSSCGRANAENLNSKAFATAWFSRLCPAGNLPEPSRRCAFPRAQAHQTGAGIRKYFPSARSESLVIAGMTVDWAHYSASLRRLT